MKFSLKKHLFLFLILILVSSLSINSISAIDLNNDSYVGYDLNSANLDSADFGLVSDSDLNSYSADFGFDSDLILENQNKEHVSNLKSLNNESNDLNTADSINYNSKSKLSAENSNGTKANSSQSNQASIEDKNLNKFLNSIENTKRGTVYLSSDLTLNQTVKLKNNITIDGKNHSITALNITNVFYVTGTITLKNIIFNNNYSENIRAIENIGTLTINKCQFNNFVYDGSGSAIYSTGKLTIKETEFNNNFADKDGGAIYSTGNMTLNKVFLDNNYACKRGGAIFSSGNLAIENSEINNQFCENDGGAIYSTGKLSIKSTEFDSNFAYGIGGAIYSAGKLSIIKAVFYDNYANGYGGAVYAAGGLTLNASEFNNNTSNASGGAIYSKNNSLDIRYSKFLGNSAVLNGGAVYSAAANMLISYSNFALNFIESYQKPSYGGAVYSYYSSKISYSNFTSNHCKTKLINKSDNMTYQSMGGALFLYTGNHSLTRCNFMKNSVDNDGGAVRVGRYVRSFILSKCNFLNNSAYYEDGGAISSASPNITIAGSVFKNNFANEDGGAIDTFSLANYTVYVSIQDCLFKSNTGFKAGGAMYLGVNTVQSLINSNFTSNKATVAGAFYIESISANITDCVFKSNKAYNVAKKTIYNKAGKVVSHSGGAIFNKNGSIVLIKNSLFSGNKATYGGAITNRGQMTISKSNFTSNNATYGGALYGGGKSLSVKDSIFYKNRASNTGGALYITEGNVSVKTSMIVSNSAKLYSGVYSTKSISLNDNWWGNTLSVKSKSPKSLKLVNVKVSSWLHLKIRAKVTDLAKGNSTTLTVSLCYNNKNKLISNSFNNPVSLTVSGGGLSSKKLNLKNGKGTLKFKMTDDKKAKVKVTLFGKTASCELKVK